MRPRRCFAVATLVACLAIQAAGQGTSSTYTFSTLAGTAGTVVNSADGTGGDAQFDAPRGVAVDTAGNVYVADGNNNTIRKIASTGAVTTLAGTAGLGGSTDGTGAAARFTEPFGLAVDSAGTIYVADSSSNAIRKITAAGVVTTLAGSREPGSVDGTGTAARLDEPRGVAVSASGTVYVADYDNHIIRSITTSGVVRTLAGTAGSQGTADGTGAAARFRGPMGIAVDATGVVYVADSGNRSIRKITTAGVVTTLALSGSGLSDPRGIAVNAAGTLYVADYGAHTVRAITPAGAVTTLAGAPSAPGAADGTGTAARFHYPSGLTLDRNGVLYVADTGNDTIRKIDSGGTVTTVAGLAGRSSSTDGQGADARFDDPFATATDSNGNVYVADSGAHIIRKIAPDGTVTTLAGSPGAFGHADGTGADARFYSPFGVAADAAGTVYVADSYNSTVRKITAEGVVTTLAGTALSRGSTDGTGAAARFDQPFGIAVDGSGTVFVSDASFNTIRRITAAGVVTTFAGSPHTIGSADGTGTAARFSVPYGVAVDGSGNVYVVDHGNHTVRKITSSGVVTTLAGTAGSAGNADGTGAAARFKFPSHLAADSAGTVFVADTDNQILRTITPAGVVTTVGGSGNPGSTDGVGTAARFFNPKGIAVDGAGTLYVADRGNHTIRKGAASAAAARLPTAALAHDGPAPSRDDILEAWAVGRVVPPVSAPPTILSTADFSGDGHPDLLVGGGGTVPFVVLMINDGRGIFEDQTARLINGLATAARAAKVTSASAGDIDADGDIDLWVYSADTRGANGFYLNQGDGTFVADTVAERLDPSLREASSAALVDVDGDGRLDLALGQARRVAFNDGHGFFRGDRVMSLPAPASGGNRAAAMAVAAADLDRDGRPDLVLTHESDAATFIQVLIQDVRGRFVDDTLVRLGALQRSARGITPQLVDLDRDADVDLLAGGVVYLNDGTGIFRALSGDRNARADDIPAPMMALDVDGDGTVDVVQLAPSAASTTRGTDGGSGLRLVVTLSRP